MALRKKLERPLKPKKRIKPRSAKNKGKALQNFVCERLSLVTGLEWDNKDDNAPIQSRQMGQSGVDIILRGDALKIIPFSFECKATKVFHPEADIAQAKANEKRNTNWALVHRKGSESPIVVIDWYAFELLIESRYWEQQNANQRRNSKTD